MTDLEKMLEIAESNGLLTEDLDDIVHEIANEAAMLANNGGLHGQLDFLLLHLGSVEAVMDAVKLRYVCRICKDVLYRVDELRDHLEAHNSAAHALTRDEVLEQFEVQ